MKIRDLSFHVIAFGAASFFYGLTYSDKWYDPIFGPLISVAVDKDPTQPIGIKSNQEQLLERQFGTAFIFTQAIILRPPQELKFTLLEVQFSAFKLGWSADECELAPYQSEVVREILTDEFSQFAEKLQLNNRQEVRQKIDEACDWIIHLRQMRQNRQNGVQAPQVVYPYTITA